jgi:hypothetical protein
MKKLATSVFVLLLTAVATLSASAQTIRRVSATTTGTNIYATFALAQTAATAGDIIQLEPGTYNFDITLSKNLTVVGPGYFLGGNQNPGLQANAQAATVNNISFNAGSTGASVSGVSVASNVFIGTNGVTLQRCYVASYIYLNYDNSIGYATVNNVNIRQNYCGFIRQYSGGYAATNLLITNNIIVYDINLGSLASGEFRQNVMTDCCSYTATLSNFNVANNYFAYQYAAPNFTNCTVSYNAFRYASYPATNNNINNVLPTSVFVMAPGSTQFDAWFQLKSGTNALRGTGENGLDIGAFAGNAPYKLGGLPAIPAIYQLSNSVNGNTLNVNMSTRSNN